MKSTLAAPHTHPAPPAHQSVPRGFLCRQAGELAKSYQVPGQFVQMKVAEKDKPGFFAIASPPGGSEMQFLIKESEGTAGALCKLAAGAEVLMCAPMGKGFAINGAAPSDYPTLLLFASGTGISPLKALVESGVADGRGDVRLYYGARDEDSMAYKDKFEDWASKGVEVVPCFSDPKGVDAQFKGYVQVRTFGGHFPFGVNFHSRIPLSLPLLPCCLRVFPHTFDLTWHGTVA